LIRNVPTQIEKYASLLLDGIGGNIEKRIVKNGKRLKKKEDRRKIKRKFNLNEYHVTHAEVAKIVCNNG
jgi:hypothetical protein